MIYIVIEKFRCMDGEYERPCFANESEEVCNKIIAVLKEHKDQKIYSYHTEQIESDPEADIKFL